MRSELLVSELASIIRRLEHRIQSESYFSAVLDQDTQDQSLQTTLDGIEQAIAGLVMLHIQVRRQNQ